MNEARIKGNWNQLVGKLQEHWGKLTDDDIAKSKDPENFIETLAARYGIGKAEAQEKFNQFVEELAEEAETQIAVLKKKVAHLAEIVGEKSKEAAEKGKEVVKNHPAASVGVVLGVGVLIGWLIGRCSSN